MTTEGLVIQSLLSLFFNENAVFYTISFVLFKLANTYIKYILTKSKTENTATLVITRTVRCSQSANGGTKLRLVTNLHDVRSRHGHVDGRAAHLPVVPLDHVDGRGGGRAPLAGLRRVARRGHAAPAHAAAGPELAGPVAGLSALYLHLYGTPHVYTRDEVALQKYKTYEVKRVFVNILP